MMLMELVRVSNNLIDPLFLRCRNSDSTKVVFYTLQGNKVDVNNQSYYRTQYNGILYDEEDDKNFEDALQHIQFIMTLK